MARIVFRDKRGRFLPQTDRYEPEVSMIQVQRKGEWITLAERSLPPDELATVLNQREFESLPEALSEVDTYTSTSKYKAWDIAEQIDKTKGIRRKDLKYTITLQDGKRRRQISFYHRVKRNTSGSYGIFQRINQEIGLEGLFLYDRAGGKILADRKGRKVRLVNIKVEQVI